ncbi:MAG TPA: SCO6880 family protein [Ilumatobacter sp.]|nr:SCO6880 family protein [Ilumatobacter sp.]
MSVERTYRLEPLDGSGVFLGLGVIQCVVLGSGLVTAVLAVTAGLALPFVVAPVALAAAMCFARVGGHPLWEWLPLGAGWLFTVLGRGRRWTARLPLWPTGDGAKAPLPPCLAGLEIVEVPWRTGRIGAVHDRERHAVTGMVTVTGPQFVVEPRAEQERLIAGWGDVLSQFAVERGPVTHIAWSDLARPSGLGEHVAWLANREVAGRHPVAAESYGELLADAAGTASNHEVALSITVSRDRLTRRTKLPGGDAEALSRALASSLDALMRGLRSAGLAPSDPLSANDVRHLLRTRIDPHAPGVGQRRGRLAQRLGLAPTAAGPLTVDTAWRHARVDGAWHRTFWVAGWPRLAVPPSWMEPFLSGGGVTRAVTVVLVPVPSHQSRRRIERDLVKLESDAATKEDKGRRVDARHRRATQALLDREEELVAGFSEVAYAGLVTVTATTEEQLDEHSEIVEQLARESGLDLRLLDGRQDIAWAAALPLGLAPKTLLAS